jgi:hypothetical protein
VGFSVYYRTTRPVSAEEAAAIRRDAEAASRGRTWLSCEPVQFFEVDPYDEGCLMGGSKPNFTPHPDAAATAAGEGHPDGNIRDVVDVLCRLSRSHGVDWEIRHDHDPAPVGTIRRGVCDPGLAERMDALADLAAILDAYERGEPPDDVEDQDEDEGPRILRLGGDA